MARRGFAERPGDVVREEFSAGAPTLSGAALADCRATSATYDVLDVNEFCRRDYLLADRIGADALPSAARVKRAHVAGPGIIWDPAVDCGAAQEGFNDRLL